MPLHDSWSCAGCLLGPSPSRRARGVPLASARTLPDRTAQVHQDFPALPCGNPTAFGAIRTHAYDLARLMHELHGCNQLGTHPCIHVGYASLPHSHSRRHSSPLRRTHSRRSRRNHSLHGPLWPLRPQPSHPSPLLRRPQLPRRSPQCLRRPLQRRNPRRALRTFQSIPSTARIPRGCSPRRRSSC